MDLNVELLLPLDNVKSSVVLIIQMILPKEKFEDKIILESQLNQLEQFLLKEFPNQKIFRRLDVEFQILNVHSQDLCKVVGKVLPNSHASMTLKNCIYCRYQFHISSQSFVLAMTEDNVRSNFYLKDDNAEWVFHDIASYIVSMRIEVQLGHCFLR